MRKYSENRKYRTAPSKHELPKKFASKKQKINKLTNTISTFFKKIFNK
jgi:hypothetical protein